MYSLGLNLIISHLSFLFDLEAISQPLNLKASEAEEENRREGVPVERANRHAHPLASHDVTTVLKFVKLIVTVIFRKLILKKKATTNC